MTRLTKQSKHLTFDLSHHLIHIWNCVPEIYKKLMCQLTFLYTQCSSVTFLYTSDQFPDTEHQFYFCLWTWAKREGGGGGDQYTGHYVMVWLSVRLPEAFKRAAVWRRRSNGRLEHWKYSSLLFVLSPGFHCFPLLEFGNRKRSWYATSLGVATVGT